MTGADITGASIANRIGRGLVLVPEDRQRDGLISLLSVSENLSMASISPFRALVDHRPRRREPRPSSVRSATWRSRYPRPACRFRRCRGGNQQKVVIGKGLLTEPRVIMFDEPTRGIDVGAKAEVFRTMGALAQQGIGVVFATSDIKEVMSAADRILVMSAGRITGDFRRAETNEAAVVAASTEGLRHLTGENRKQAS